MSAAIRCDRCSRVLDAEESFTRVRLQHMQRASEYALTEVEHDYCDACLDCPALTQTVLMARMLLQQAILEARENET